MLNDLSLDAVHSHQLIYDLIDDCTENISSGIDLALPSIVTLYVVCKAADQLFVEGLELLLEKTLKLLTKKCN